MSHNVNCYESEYQRRVRGEDEEEDEKEGGIIMIIIIMAFSWLLNHLGYNAINTMEPRQDG